MEWTDEGILLSARRHGEASVVASVLTREHGRHAGLIRGGAGKGARGALQPGNHLAVGWKARLAEHLGHLTWELAAAHGSLWLEDRPRLACVVAMCAMAEATLPEREPHPAAFDGMLVVLDALRGEDWPSLYVHWELGLLGELGYGLDLGRCAVSGASEDLAYVSPRSGRAVSRSAGEPYKDRLLPLPAFLLEKTAGAPADIVAGLALTGYFLERHVLVPQGKPMPPARSRLVDRLKA